MGVVRVIVILLRAFLLRRAVLAAKTLVLRHQLGVLRRAVSHPRLPRRDRILWVWLSQLWADWRSSLIIVKPETIVRWHRGGFKHYWRWKSRKRTPGRPKIDAEIRRLIRQVSRENATWGPPRIHSELALLGYVVAKSTVVKYIDRSRKPPSQTWRTFLENHIRDIAAIDFFVVPTVRFQLLYCFVVLRHDRRRVLHFNVPSHPTARWTAQQVVAARSTATGGAVCGFEHGPAARRDIGRDPRWRLNRVEESLTPPRRTASILASWVGLPSTIRVSTTSIARAAGCAQLV